MLPFGIIVHAGSVNIQSLPPEYLLRRPDITNSFEQFIKNNCRRLLFFQSSSFMAKPLIKYSFGTEFAHMRNFACRAGDFTLYPAEIITSNLVILLDMTFAIFAVVANFCNN